MMIFPCHICQTPLSAEESQAGLLVRCPSCKNTLRVPALEKPVAATMATEVAGAGAAQAAPQAAAARVQVKTPPFPGLPARPGGRRYGFNCKYCSSRLEATDSMQAQEGQCPTCGSNIVIPILDRQGRLIDPETRQIIKQDPHPVHAYAAAGQRAPVIIRAPDDRQFILCPRCQTHNPISANNCKNCGTPFTMEGTTLEVAGSSNGFCVASLVLGIISIPTFFVLGIIAVLAIIFGIAGLNQVSKSGAGGRGLAIAGIVCGCVGGGISFLVFIVR